MGLAQCGQGEELLKGCISSNQSHFFRKLIHEFQKNYILDLGDVIKAHQLQANQANDEEENSDESVILRVENIIEASKLQEWANLSSRNE